MTDTQVINILKEWGDALSFQHFYTDALRSVGWGVLKGMMWVCDGCWATVEQIYGLLGFSNSAVMQKYITSVHPLVVLLLTISLLGFGVYLLTRKGSAQINLLQSVIAIVLIITILPAISAKVGSLTKYSAEYTRGQYQVESPSFTLIDGNIVDLLKIDGMTGESSFSNYHDIVENAGTGNKDKKNHLTKKSQIKNININEYVDYTNDGFFGLGGNELVHSDVFANQISTDKDGKEVLYDMDKGLIDSLKNYYYRYHVNWGTLIFSMLAMSIALAFSAFKSAKIVWEIGFHQVIGPFIAVSDLASGQRTKEFLRSLISLFAALFLISAVMGIYFIGLRYLASNASKLTMFTDLVCKIALAWFVMDGPNVVERIIGVDVGIKDARGMVMGMWAASRTAGGVAKGVKAAAVGSAFGRGGKIGGVAGATASVTKGVGTATVGKEGMEAAKEAVFGSAEKDGSAGKRGVVNQAKNAVKNTTGGFGAAGAVYAAGKGVSNLKENMDAKKMGPNNLGGEGIRTSGKTLGRNAETNHKNPVMQKSTPSAIPGIEGRKDKASGISSTGGKAVHVTKPATRLKQTSVLNKGGRK